MKYLHEVQLPHHRPFYTDPRDFEVRVDNNACGQFTLPDGTQFQLNAAAPVLAPFLQGLGVAPHRASLEAISEAAMRFYRAGGVRSFSETEYVSMLFLMRYGFGQAFRISAKNSIEHANGDDGCTLHSEALTAHTELFAYGLACHFSANLLGVPIDRFFFITANGARADFRARITAADLNAAGSGMGTLAPAGYVVELEVKARTGWRTFRSDNAQGVALLKNLADKVANRPQRAFLSIIVGLSSSPGGPRSIGRLVIADPGEGVPLDERAQTILLLEEAITLLYRHGLWVTLLLALNWLAELRQLNEHEEELREYVAQFEGARQYSIVGQERRGRRFNGRIFNDVLMRVGRRGERGMDLEEAEERLRLDELGHAWFSGVDVRYLRVIEERDAASLRTFGVRGLDSEDLAGQSAFYIEEESMTDDLRVATRNALRRELGGWR